ncbi:MAG: DinB family protein [Gemmatimonadaceae bacterium]
MTIAHALLPEFDTEMATTRRLLERVPGDKGRWKPHDKSFPLGHLAQLIASMPGWVTQTLRFTELDLEGFRGYSYETTATLVGEFDRNVTEARAAIGSARDKDFAIPWSLKHGERVLLTMPRGAVVRMHVSHLIHHRGQLSVYLRLNDVPLPPIYGPTADERM